MTTEDVLLEDLGIEGLALVVVSGETLLGVGDENTTVRSTLEGTKHTRAGRGALEADIEVGLEWPWGTIDSFGHADRAIGLGNTLVLVGETKLGKSSASSEETSRIGYANPRVSIRVEKCIAKKRTSSPVGETVLNPVPRELAGVGGDENKVTLQARIDDLDGDVLVGEANDKAVLGRIAKLVCKL